MTRSSALLFLLLSACAAVPPQAGPVRQAQQVQPLGAAAQVKSDLEGTARAKFGAALTEQALAYPAFILAKHYMGLPPPPIVQPDGSYRYPDPPMTMLVRRSGQWLAARAGAGFAPVAGDKAAAIEAALSDPGLWREPDFAQPGCTDAGSSLIWMKLPGRPTLVRRGTCGASARTESLIFHALEAG